MTTSAASRKSAEAFRTISEVADALKLPQHVLRFWETRFAQIKPLKRAGGRRFYRPEDVELLGAIRQLLYGEGYTIKGVQRMLREQGPRAVAALAQGRGGTPVPVEAVDETAAEAGERDAEAREGGGPEAGPDRDASPEVGIDADQDIAELLRAALAELAECRRILSSAARP